MPTIFVSYSRVDKKFTRALVERLHKIYGYDSVWYDDSLHGGDIWWDEILNQIAAADIFLYLLSNESVTSPYCQAEFEEAQRLQKQLITVQVRDRTNLTGKLRDIQYVDMTAGANDGLSFDHLLASINRQATGVKKRRALWRPRTQRPDMKEAEADPSGRAPVTTPDLQPANPGTVKKSSWLNESKAIIISAIITGIFALVAAYMALENRPETPSSTDVAQNNPLSESAIRETAQAEFNGTLTALAPTDVIDIPTATSEPNTPTSVPPSATNTPEPDTPVPPSPTTDPLQEALQHASSRKSSNAEWESLYPDGFLQSFDGVEMVLVPAGCFIIGAKAQADNEKNGNEICFDEPFWIDQTEAVQSQLILFEVVIAKSPSFMSSNRPIENVTWFEARTFCINRGGRLPTEAEWEYAARGPSELHYPWGRWSDDPIYTIWNRESSQGTEEVGSLPAGMSWVGALDMSGNVWEWTSSQFEMYPYDDGREGEVDNPELLKVLRGGSWISIDPFFVRSGFRFWNPPTNWDDDIGFRCVRSI